MGKQPSFQFYPNDWSRDLEEYPLEIEGAWIRICCKLWWSDERGKLTRSDEQWSRILRVDNGKATSILDYIGEHKIGLVEKQGNNITVTSRRMYREYKSSISNKERQAKFREKGGGDPENWTSIRIPILKRDEYMCAYCGRRGDTVDHITPKSQGGTEDESNLVACCKRCNSRKGDRTLEESGMTFWKGYDIEKLQYNTNITPPSSSSSSSSSSEEVIKKDVKKRDSTANAVQGIVDLYNEHCPSLPRAQRISKTRKQRVTARLREYPEDELLWVDYFKMVESSDFLTGRNGKWTSCNFDWLMNENNIIKVLEGTYNNKEQGQASFDGIEGVLKEAFPDAD